MDGAEVDRQINRIFSHKYLLQGRAIAQAVSRWLPTGSGQVGFVVDKVALVWVFFEYFGFPCQYSTVTLGLVQ
jgi:hypothetical protein